MVYSRKLTILGDPVAQGRPRFFTRGQFHGAFDPPKSRNYKDMVRAQVLEQIRGYDSMPDPVTCPLEMTVSIFMPRPKSRAKALHHVVKPDASNVVKGIEDALNGLVYKDDSQITRLHATKEYGDPPRVEIVLKEITGA